MKNQRKAILKTLTWRTVSSILFFGVTFAGTGSWETAGWMMVVDGFLKTFAYYIHELSWQGKMTKKS